MLIKFRYANDNNIPIIEYKPDWKIGKHAGLLRNTDILKVSKFLMLINFRYCKQFYSYISLSF